MKNYIDEGTWFSIPLRAGSHSIGVVARTSRGGGIILAYLFGRNTKTLPTMQDTKGLSASGALRVARVGDLGLMNGRWPIIGRDPMWRRAAWPMPLFVRRDEIGKRAWCVQYSDDDANELISETVTKYETVLERDAVLGSGSVETVLSKLAESSG